MKLFLLALFILVHTASLSFADDSAMAAVMPASAHTRLGGMVKASVFLGRPE